MALIRLVDLVVVTAYLLGITAIGLRFYHKKTTLQDYLIGSKGISWVPIALSIVAAETSAIAYLGTSAWTFTADFKLNQSLLGFFIAIPIVIWLFLPVYSRNNWYTVYEFLERRFDLTVRLTCTVLFLLLRGTHVAVIIYAPALMMAEMYGLPLTVSVLTMGILTAFYTSMGGIRAVIWTDAIQVGTVFVGITIIFISALNEIPGGIQEVLSTGMAHGKFRMFDFSLDLEKVDSFWTMLLGSTLLFIQQLTTDQAVAQKYFSSRSKSETSKSLILYGVMIVPTITLLSVLGVVLFVLYQNRPDLNSTLTRPDAVLAHFAARALPPGLCGLVVASIFAGSMSTVSASLNSLAASSVVDIYKRLLRTDSSDRHFALASRYATFVWGSLATVGALYADRLGPLILAFAKVQSLLGGIILGIFVLAVVSKRANTAGVMTGAIAGLAVVLYLFVFTSVSIYLYCVFGLVCTVVVGWCISIALNELPKTKGKSNRSASPKRSACGAGAEEARD